MKVQRTRNYVRGLTSGYVVTLATVLVGLWLTPFTLRYLDREEFGVFTLAGDVLIWLGLLELGITSVLNVKAAQLSGKPDQQQLNRLASTTFFAQCCIALIMGGVGTVVTVLFPEFFGLCGDLRQDAVLLMALMVTGAALHVATQTFSALLVAHQQIHVDNGIRLGLLGIRTGLTVLLLTQGVGLISLAAAHLTAIVVTGCLAVLRVFRLLPGLSLRWRHFSWRLLKETGGLGIWFSLGGIAGFLIMSLDRVVTAKVVSVEMVTTFTLTGRLYMLAWTLLRPITDTARPALAQIIGEDRKGLALERFRQLSSLSTGLALVAAASVWACNRTFVEWWVGPVNYGGVALDAVLALNLIAHCWVLPNRAILVAAMAYVPQNAVSRFIEGGINLAASLVLGQKYGLVGVAAGTTLAAVVATVWYFPLLTSRLLGVSFRRLYGSSVVRLGAVALMVFGAGHSLRGLGARIDGLTGAATSGVVAAGLGVGLLWFTLAEGDRSLFRSYVSRRVGTLWTRSQV